MNNGFVQRDRCMHATRDGVRKSRPVLERALACGGDWLLLCDKHESCHCTIEAAIQQAALPPDDVPREEEPLAGGHVPRTIATSKLRSYSNLPTGLSASSRSAVGHVQLPARRAGSVVA